jgi:UDP-N-acetylglucosamine--N-acetylmuramyl-(pentapeptide) pyrophosphoryl-undecaprenol N-acetylglucosamine transferase
LNPQSAQTLPNNHAAPPVVSTTGGPRRCVLLAAGGTGGHIYPAIALAEAIAELDPAVKIKFCCGARPAELQIYHRLKIRPWIMPVAYNRPGILWRCRFIGQMLASWRKSRRRLKRRPVDVAVGFGSYVSVPPLVAARMRGACIVLHEQNLRRGTANRLLTPLARWIAMAGEPAGDRPPAKRTRIVGNPVRASMQKPGDRDAARKFFRLKPDRLVCLCVGGSQGAVGLNRLLLNLIGRMLQAESHAGRWQLLWSTGMTNYQAMTEAIKSMGSEAGDHILAPYIERMDLAYASADLVLARAGALTLAELTALGKPAVLAPLPTAKGGHQEENARRLVQAGAAVLLSQDAPEAPAQLETWLSAWAQAPETLEEMSRASRALGRPGAAKELARLVLELAGEKKI